MQLDDRTGPFEIAYKTADVTDAAITEPSAVYDDPLTADGYIQLNAAAGGGTPQKLVLVPYGTGTATKTLLMAIYGLRLTAGKGPIGQRKLWIPYIISAFTCTLCTLTGKTDGDVDASHKFCGTIVSSAGVDGIDHHIHSPTGNAMANIIQYVYGATYVKIALAIGSTQATAANCLVATD